jgi:ABC-2 type transport system ATP-binding protein
MEPAVVVDGVSKSYGDRTALGGVDLSVDAGEVVALLGPNGAGKTTLVRAITGTTDVDGEVRLFGAPPGEADPERLGVLPQEFTPPERLTARELVAYYAGLYEAPRPVEAVLEEVGVAGEADVRYEDLSGGNKRRTTLGIALVSDPDLVVLDEPTTGIDPAGRREVRGLVADLAAGGATVLVTTHDVSEAERFADRVCLLADGAVVATGPPADLVREHGGRPRLLVETDADADAVPGAEAAEGGLALPGVDREDLPAAVDRVDRAGVDYASLRWSRPGLEDVYLELTGTRPSAGERSLNRVAEAGEPRPDGGRPTERDPPGDAGVTGRREGDRS